MHPNQAPRTGWIILLSSLCLPFLQAQGPASKTDKYRLIWTESPSTTATLAWNQIAGPPGVVHYGEQDHGRDADAYPHIAKASETNPFGGMKNCFARLNPLKPDTSYYCVIQDNSGTSRRFLFRTAPSRERSFTFIVGGDSRNHRDVRIAANQTVAKLRPLFVAFTGDMINHDQNEEWHDWLDDWQHTTSQDGWLIPIVPHRGNHERRPASVPMLFNTSKGVYFDFSIGGDLFHYFALNSEILATGKQGKWLTARLQSVYKNTTHLVAGYHKPMRPHVSTKKEGANPLNWANDFYQYGLDIAFESDSHVMKRTLPLKPSPKGHEGFIAAPKDPKATVYLGEGCWGAPLRKNDDNKPWTLDSGSFNGFDWVHVTPKEIQVKTVQIKKTARIEPITSDDSFDTPKGLTLWNAKSGEILTIPAD